MDVKYDHTLFYAREALFDMATVLVEAGRAGELVEALLDEKRFEDLADEIGASRAYPSWSEIPWSEAYAQDVIGWAHTIQCFRIRSRTPFIKGFLIGIAESHLAASSNRCCDDVSYGEIAEYLEDLNPELHAQYEVMAEEAWNRFQTKRLESIWERCVEGKSLAQT